jgi:hypothetical protein
MVQPPEDLSLGAGLIRKGEARGLSPALAAAPAASVSAVATPTPVAHPPIASEPSGVEVDDPPLRAVPPDDIPKRFTSFRLPVALDEELRAMMFETRRSKQDLLIDFVTQGIKVWRRDRAKR